MSDIDDLINRLSERQQCEFAIACARRVQHLMTDPRSLAALDVAERHLRGEATDEELAAARDAAWAAWVAAWAAARDAARDAARAAWAAARDAARAAAWAAWAAARDAARDSARDAARAAWAAARDAARAAAWAAWAAARDAERAWQREELERMLKEGGGA